MGVPSHSTDGRIEWIDALRGAAILLVVIYHAEITLPNSTGAPTRVLSEALSPVPMPLLMLLSGCLVPQSLSKGVRPFLTGKLRSIAWPYFGWQAQFIIMNGSVAGLLALSHWGPISTLWFLFFIGIYYCVAPLGRIVPWYLLSAMGFALWIFVPIQWTDFFLYAGWFYAGAAIGRRFTQVTPPPWATWAAAAAFVASALLTVVVSPDGGLRVLVSAVGVAAAITLASRWRAGTLRSVCAWAGKRSIALYVLHYPITRLSLEILAPHLSETRLALWAVVLVLTLGLSVLGATLRFTWPASLLFEFPRLGGARRRQETPHNPRHPLIEVRLRQETPRNRRELPADRLPLANVTQVST